MPRLALSLPMRLNGRDSRYRLDAAGSGALARCLSARPWVMLVDGRAAHHQRQRIEALQGKRAPARLVLGGGERVKSLRQLERIYHWLALRQLPRDGTIVAVGGGAVLDVAGLAASTWLRGIEFVAVPTTLLAMVDAAVGGKTALNLAGLKNPVGTFYPAQEILADPAFLSTLPRREWRQGLAETIKAALLGSPSLFRELEAQGGVLAELFATGPARETVPAALTALPWARWIARAVRVKAAIVQEDFQEAHRRRALNLGHTLGHVLESSGRWSHGDAVAVGMAAAARIAVRRGMCPAQVGERLCNLLLCCGLPVSAAAPPRAVLERLLASDKKRRARRRSAGGHQPRLPATEVRWVLPTGIGRAALDQRVDLVEAAAALRG